ncbi:gamma-glutamylcyclotransferase [Nitratireductor mangrovi]|uniref:glutathione-specific gamma-glutamylcyclotransferase n=1 Tax=Nitratireductor mangrovi TaxID=2599600 RepID=A0A5B8L4Y7_9HYPH|nr:gamma-glutamylcyclotransferase [Nitratireductor mangrovi]QDZ02974.2 gamma-glutamylcyclotransferase [Nitratireductor mangrovi]
MRLTRQHVARVHRAIDDPGPMERQKLVPKDWFTSTARAIRAELCPGEPLWVFAFGSLIWRSPIEFSGRRVGLVRGWHREFCLGWDTRYRGNPEQPGLMLSLDRGGSCKGVALKIEAERLDPDLVTLLEREPPITPRWVSVITQDGPLRAIAFVCARNYPGYVGGLSTEEIADRLAVAVGFWGTMAEYLRNTVEHLEELGLHDRHLWRMQEMVAERIEGLAGAEGTVGSTLSRP